MTPKTIIWILAALIFASFAYGQEAFINGDTVFTVHSKGMVGQTPHTISRGTSAIISLETTSNDKSYDLCFNFYGNDKDVEIVRVEKKRFLGLFNQDLKENRKNNGLKCIKTFDNKGNLELEFEAVYNGPGKIKYDIYVLPSRYNLNFDDANRNNDLIVLDPYLIGDMAEEAILYLTFDNTSNGYVRNRLSDYVSYYNTDGFSDQAYMIDNNNNTAASKSFSSTSTIEYNYYLGYTFSARDVNYLTYRVRMYPTLGNTIHQIKIEEYNGADWNELGLYSADTNIAGGTIMLNNNSQGYRVRFNYRYDGASTPVGMYVYDLTIHTNATENASFYNNTVLNNSLAVYVNNTRNETGGAIYFNNQSNQSVKTITLTQTPKTTSFWYKNSSGTWHHIANVSNTFYRDGVSATKPLDYPIWINNSVYIGRINNITYFNGSIDEVLMFNSDLSLDDIQTLAYGYNSTASITFRDEETNQVVENVSLDVISDSFAENYSTTTGQMFISGIPQDLVTLRYESPGYYERLYYINITNYTVVNLTLYLVNSTDASAITATVYDNINNEVEDCYIKYLRYDIDSNSYKIVGIAKTNVAGEATLYMVKNIEFYKFMLYYPYNRMILDTSPDYILNDNLNFQIDIINSVAENFENTFGIDHDLTYNNDTDNFRFTYSDTSGQTQTVRLAVYKVTDRDKQLEVETTMTGSAGTLLAPIVPENNSVYLAQAYVSYLTGEELIDTYDYVMPVNNVFGNIGLYIVWALTIAFAFIGFYSIGVAVILVILPSVFGVAIGLIPKEFYPITFGLMVCAIIVSILLGEKG